MSREFKIPQYTPSQINGNISYGLTKEDNISQDELDSIQWLCEAYEHQNKQIADLEAKLVESEKEKDYYQDLYFTSVKGQEKLKQQLAEKEKEIEYYQKLINDICNKNRVASLKELDEFYQATTESLYASREYLDELKSEKWKLEKQVKQQNQDKISFCIEKLEKVKEFVKETSGIVGHEWRIDRFRVLDTIDNQIEELKKEMK